MKGIPKGYPFFFVGRFYFLKNLNDFFVFDLFLDWFS